MREPCPTTARLTALTDVHCAANDLVVAVAHAQAPQPRLAQGETALHLARALRFALRATTGAPLRQAEEIRTLMSECAGLAIDLPLAPPAPRRLTIVPNAPAIAPAERVGPIHRGGLINTGWPAVHGESGHAITPSPSEPPPCA